MNKHDFNNYKNNKNSIKNLSQLKTVEPTNRFHWLVSAWHKVPRDGNFGKIINPFSWIFWHFQSFYKAIIKILSLVGKSDTNDKHGTCILNLLSLFLKSLKEVGSLMSIGRFAQRKGVLYQTVSRPYLTVFMFCQILPENFQYCFLHIFSKHKQLFHNWWGKTM